MYILIKQQFNWQMQIVIMIWYLKWFQNDGNIKVATYQYGDYFNKAAIVECQFMKENSIKELREY